MLERLEKVNSSFEEVRLGSLSDYQKKDPANLPTHFTLELQENGYDKVKYFRKKLK